MATSWRFSAAPFVVVAAALLGVVKPDEDGPSPLDVDFSPETVLNQAEGVVKAIPGGLKHIFHDVTHPFHTIGSIWDTLRPDHLIHLPRKHLSCSHHSFYSFRCCVNITVPFLQIHEHVCQNLTFNPMNLSASLDILLDERSLIKSVLSGSHPPPLCIPFPPQLPLAALCARLHDLGFEKDGFRICLSNDIQVFFKKVLSLHFNCVHIGFKGIYFETDPKKTTKAPAVTTPAGLTDGTSSGVLSPLSTDDTSPNQEFGETSQPLTTEASSIPLESSESTLTPVD